MIAGTIASAVTCARMINWVRVGSVMGIMSVISMGIMLTGCARHTVVVDQPLDKLVQEADRIYALGKFAKAADAYEEIERQYPYADQAARAQLMAGYCAYQAGKYARAAATLEGFLALHPSSRWADYAYYVRALAYYGDILGVQRDRGNTELAVQALQELMTRFPNSAYVKDATRRLVAAKEHLAAYDMCVGRGYMNQRAYGAALAVWSDMAHQWPDSVLMPEVTYRMAECQGALGLVPAAGRTVAYLGHKYGAGNKWYGYGQKLMQTLQAAQISQTAQSSMDAKKNIDCVHRSGTDKVPAFGGRKKGA